MRDDMTELEEYMYNNDLDDDDVLRIVKGVGEHSYLRESNFTFEIEDNSAYIETNKDYDLKIKAIDTNKGYIDLIAVKKEKYND